jgi:hypothetical protein
MYDEDSGEEIQCPHCGEAGDCSHRLALIDRTFGDCTSGYCASRYNKFSKLVESAFLEQLKRGKARTFLLNDPDLDELWQCAFDEYKDDEYVWIDGGVLTRLVINLLNHAGGEEYLGLIEDEGGPGCSSALTLYFAENPSAVVEAALSELRKRLADAPKAFDSDVQVARAKRG